MNDIIKLRLPAIMLALTRGKIAKVKASVTLKTFKVTTAGFDKYLNKHHKATLKTLNADSYSRVFREAINLAEGYDDLLFKSNTIRAYVDIVNLNYTKL